MRRKVRRVCGRFGGGALLGVLALAAGGPTVAVAQGMPAPGPLTLTVQPRTMATGTQNPAAGSYPLDSIPSSAIITVPPQCVGAQRCPLVVVVAGNDVVNEYGPAAPVTWWLRSATDKYGLILLAASLHLADNASRIDSVLTQVLQQFAVDPAKIAIVGQFGSGWSASRLGAENPHVFNRIAVISGEVYTQGLDLRAKQAELLVDIEADGSTLTIPAAVRQLQRAGQPVTVVATLRGPEPQREGYDFLGRWLTESWRVPDPAVRSGPAVVADPLPLVTPEMLAKMTVFWTEFQKGPKWPDTIRAAERVAHLRAVAVPVGPAKGDRISTWMTDMAALARYPLVAAALRKAGLTARQHDVYRVALLSSLLTPVEGEPLPAGSVLAKNIAFRQAHKAEYEALAKAGTREEWVDLVRRGTPTLYRKAWMYDILGALGMWRMP